MAQKLVRLRRTKDVLIDVDIQPAFLSGGGLAVPDGDAIVPIVTMIHGKFAREQTFLTLDRHPRGHVSLASSYVGLKAFSTLDAKTAEGMVAHDLAPDARFTLDQLRAYLAQVGSQVLWPDHALAGTPESALCDAFDALEYVHAQIKGMDPACDSYSGFRDNLRRPTGLAEQIRKRVPAAERVFITGLAYDYCVGWTALDAIDEGFKAVVIKDATRAIDRDGSVARMEDAFRAKGVRVIESSLL